VGSTFIRALDRYARTLQAGNNRLMLEGPSEHVVDQLEKTDLLDLIGGENVFPGQPEFGAALRDALAAAEEWLAQGEENGE
jgi:SulP family sulfate permease